MDPDSAPLIGDGGAAPAVAVPPRVPSGDALPPHPDDAPPPGSGNVILMKAIAQQDKWITSQGRLESEG